jgi:hypothetical protein
MAPHKRLLQQKPDPRRSRDGAWERLGGSADEQLWAERKAARLKDLLRCSGTTAPRSSGSGTELAGTAGQGADQFSFGDFVHIRILAQHTNQESSGDVP